ncbi:MAG: hypothetical protein GXO73_09615 [Calditrichaeota bacterium]|nr:hypothetical protein [Calditrichota bacterium]
MAEEEKEKTSEDSGKKAKGGGLLPKILIGVAVVTMQLVLSVVVVKRLVEPPPPQPQAAQAQQDKEVKPEDIGDVYLVEDVIVNPLNSRGRKFLNTSIAFVYKGKVGTELEKRDVQLRDMLLQTLGERTVKELSQPAERDTLREEILRKTNELLTSGKVMAVYFTNFVMQ